MRSFKKQVMGMRQSFLFALALGGIGVALGISVWLGSTARVPVAAVGPEVASRAPSVPGAAAPKSAPPNNPPAVPIECRWHPGQTFAFDVAVDSELTFNEAALAPLLSRQRIADTPGRTQKATGVGRLEAKVIAVTSAGEGIIAARLGAWTTEPALDGLFPGIEADMRRPYLLRVDSRCHAVATARPNAASVIAYRRVLGLVDRMDFALPPANATPTQAYTDRQVDEFGWYTLSNQYRADRGRGSIERQRLAYESLIPAKNALALQIRIHTAGGTVTLGDSAWFAALSDHEDIEAVSNGAVPLRSRSTASFTQRRADAHAFDGVPLVLADFVWGRPTEAELEAAHEAARGGALKGVSAHDAVTEFRALRDGGKPGAWHDAQRLLRDWMRANPDGVRDLAQQMAQGQFSRPDQADFVLAMAKSGSDVARHELEHLVNDSGGNTDLRVQAASACGDLTQPTTDTVDMLAQVGAGGRGRTAEDMLPSAATMALGVIVDNAPGTAAADAALAVLHERLRAGDTAKKVEALYAASNSGDPSFLKHTQAAAASGEPEERAAAAHAVRKMLPSDPTTEMLNGLLREDTNPDVVKQVAESRREQLQTYGGALSGGELSLYATKLPGAPEGVRWEILRTLGTASRLQPEASAILVEWYHHESVNALKGLIGQYIPAAALRG